jgi:hypothetical protein
MHIIGAGHDVVVHGHLRLWAERGLVHIEDARDNSYSSVAVREMLYRLRGLNDMLKNSKQQLKKNGFADAERYKGLQDLVEALAAVCEKAQEQGMPSDASAVRDLNRRLPRTVIMPAALPAF